MQFSLFQLVSAFLLLWCIWKLVKLFILLTALDDVPGPRPDSLLTGMLLFLATTNGLMPFER